MIKSKIEVSLFYDNEFLSPRRRPVSREETYNTSSVSVNTFINGMDEVWGKRLPHLHMKMFFKSNCVADPESNT